MTRDLSGALTAVCVLVGFAARARLLERKAEALIAQTAGLTACLLMHLISTKLFSR